MSFDLLKSRIERKEKGRQIFMQFIEEHQRAWGRETYKGRPTLEQMLSSPVVAFWQPTSDEMFFTATVHKELKEIEQYLLALLIHSEVRLPVLRLKRVFVNQQPKKIANISIEFK